MPKDTHAANKLDMWFDESDPGSILRNTDNKPKNRYYRAMSMKSARTDGEKPHMEVNVPTGHPGQVEAPEPVVG